MWPPTWGRRVSPGEAGAAFGRWFCSGPPQVRTCEVGSRPVPGGGAVGYWVPFGWSGLFRHLGAQRPGGAADSGGGARLSLKKVGGKNTRGKPLDPAFIAARSHSLVFGLVVSDPFEGLFRPVC